MKESTYEEVLRNYTETHLICDSSHPLITNSTLEDEAMLYNLNKPLIDLIIDDYTRITGKTLSALMDISTLSGGQKVVLMTLLALHSSAGKIVFINLDSGLDKERAEAVFNLIETFKMKKSEILKV